jgi:hypothetical protein
MESSGRQFGNQESICSMISLETQFVSGKGGFYTEPRTYTQLERTDTFALYERSFDGSVKDYEVFKIMIHKKGRIIFKKVVQEDTEHYPSNAEFGRFAWSCSTKERAMELFNQLCNPALVPAKVIVEVLDGEEDEENEVETNEVKPPKEKAKLPDLLVPVGTFTMYDLAESNHVEYPIAVLFVKTALDGGTVKCVGSVRVHARGPARKLFSKA